MLCVSRMKSDSGMMALPVGFQEPPVLQWYQGPPAQGNTNKKSIRVCFGHRPRRFQAHLTRVKFQWKGVRQHFASLGRSKDLATRVYTVLRSRYFVIRNYRVSEH